jgi:hypothetical protein
VEVLKSRVGLYVVVPKSARVGRSVDYQLTITSRLFTRLTMFSFECISSEPV